MTFTQAFRYEISIGESAPFAELAAFVDRARENGAQAGTPVQVVPLEQSIDVVDHLLVELDSTASPAPRRVIVSLTVIQEIRTLLGDLLGADGDARGYEAGLRVCHSILAELADGNDIPDHLDW